MKHYKHAYLGFVISIKSTQDLLYFINWPAMINPGDDTFATEAHSDSMQVKPLNLPRFCMWNKLYTFILHAMCSISRVSLGQVLEEWVSGSCTWNLKRYFLYQKFTALLTRKTFLLKCILFLNVVCFKE